MSVEKVREYFRQHGLADRIMEFGRSSATVELAAAVLECEPGRIAKTLSFALKTRVLLIVAAGDARKSSTPTGGIRRRQSISVASPFDTPAWIQGIAGQCNACCSYCTTLLS